MMLRQICREDKQAVKYSRWKFKGDSRDSQ